MNKKQKILLTIGCLLFIAATIYPEWISKIIWHEDSYTNINSAGRHFLLFPPEESYRGYREVTNFKFVNTTRLFIEWTTIILPTTVLYFVFQDNNSKT